MNGKMVGRIKNDETGGGIAGCSGRLTNRKVILFVWTHQ